MDGTQAVGETSTTDEADVYSVISASVNYQVGYKGISVVPTEVMVWVRLGVVCTCRKQLIPPLSFEIIILQSVNTGEP